MRNTRYFNYHGIFNNFVNYIRLCNIIALQIQSDVTIVKIYICFMRFIYFSHISQIKIDNEIWWTVPCIFRCYKMHNCNIPQVTTSWFSS